MKPIALQAAHESGGLVSVASARSALARGTDHHRVPARGELMMPS